MQLSDAVYQTVVEAITAVRLELRWKPGKAQQHLIKRIERGHLSPETTLSQYEAIIRSVLLDPTAQVFVFQFGQTFYPTVVAEYADKAWLVMVGLNGILETAFPPDDVEDYVYNDPSYIRIGPIDEVSR